MADQLNAVGCVPSADGLGHLGPRHAVDKAEAKDHTGLIVMDFRNVRLDLFLLRLAYRFQVCDLLLKIFHLDHQGAYLV